MAGWLASPSIHCYINIMNLNDYLRGKTLLEGGLCYGSILHFSFEGGSIATAGGDWSLEIGDHIVETSEIIENSSHVSTLVGRTIRDLVISDPGSCRVNFWDGVVLKCRDGSYEGYGMGREMLNVYQDDRTGKRWIYELHAPLVDLSWRCANQPVSASY